jgi:hypothetical protein
MELFDIEKIIFQDHKRWKDVTNGDKKKNFFMLNRFFSINYPLQAQLLQHIKSNPVAVMDFWFDFLSKRYNKIPFWIYIKGVKKSKEVKEKKPTHLSKEIIYKYCQTYNLDTKTIQDGMLLFPEATIKEIKEFEKLITNKK